MILAGSYKTQSGTSWSKADSAVDLAAATGLSAAPYSVPKQFPLAALAGHAVFEITRIGKLLRSRLQWWTNLDVSRDRLWGTDIGGTDIADVPARSQLQATQDAMVALPRDLRDALTLVCVDGLSYRQAADQLGIPVAALNSRLARARAILAEELGLLPRQQELDCRRTDEGKPPA